MGKTLRYGEFKFPSDFGFKDSSAPEGRKLVQFYAGGGRVKKAAKGGLSAAKGMDGIGYTPPPAPAPMPPMPAAAKPPRAAAPSGGRKPKGMPDLMARARIPGGMQDGGAVSDAEQRRRMAQGSISDADERLIQRASPRAGAISDGEQRRLIDSMGSGAISDADRRRMMMDSRSFDASGSSMKKAYAKGGAAHSDVAMDKKLVKRAVHKHEASMHPGKPMTKLARGGVPSHRGKPMYGGGKC